MKPTKSFAREFARGFFAGLISGLLGAFLIKKFWGWVIFLISTYPVITPIVLIGVVWLVFWVIYKKKFKSS